MLAWKVSLKVVRNGEVIKEKEFYIERKRDLRLKDWKKLDKDNYVYETDRDLIILKFKATEPVFRRERDLFRRLHSDEREYLSQLKKLVREKGIRRSGWKAKSKRRDVKRGMKWADSWSRYERKKVSETMVGLKVLKRISKSLVDSVSEANIDDVFMERFILDLKLLWKNDRELFWETMFEVGSRNKEFALAVLDEFFERMNVLPRWLPKHVYKVSLLEFYEQKLFSYVNGELDGITLVTLFPELESENEWRQYVYGDARW